MLDSTTLDRLARVAALLRDADRTLFITGAGLSADSGLPTYRGIGGLYESDDTDEGIPIEVALSGRMLRDRPEVCWKYIHQIEASCRDARHNRAHEVIAAVEADKPGTCVLTQNVDGFHVAAGSRNVIAIHGDVHRLKCTRCPWRQEVADYSDLDIPPRCPDCGELVRPDVVLFGELLPPDAVDALHAELRRGFDLVFTIGTTSVFPYIAAPVWEARKAGVPTVEINPDSSDVSDIVQYRLQAGAAEVMDALWAAVRAG